MAQSGYKSELHSALPYIDKFYKELLDLVSDANGRSKKRQTEMSIEDAFIKQFGYEEYRARKDAHQASVSK